MSVQFGMNDYVNEGHKPFASAWCGAQITETGFDVNSKGTGRYVWMEFTVLDGPDKGRTLRQFYNYEHSNEDAERISREHICAIARFVDVATIVLPDRLHEFNNKKLRIKISQKKDEEFPNVKEYDKYQDGSIPGFEDDIPDFTPRQDHQPYGQ